MEKEEGRKRRSAESLWSSAGTFAYNNFESLGTVLSESYYSHKDIPKEGAVVLIVVKAAY